jgi:NitT/TauT family transport system ATP-binding protein
MAETTAAPGSPAFLTITDLCKEYPGNPAVVRDFSLCASAGEFVTLLGASGCGKSTLLALIAGLTPMSGGSILIGGRTPPHARAITSFVFQDPTLLPWRTVAGNVELMLELEGLPRAARAARSAAVLEWVGLRGVGGQLPRQLSGGMKMRVSIARALATTPQLLLMDEPFGALDEMTRNRLNEELLALRERQGWTAVFVTHSIPEAVFLSDRIILMGAHPGRVVEEIAVPLPARRTAALRSDPRFLELVGRVSRALMATGS